MKIVSRTASRAPRFGGNWTERKLKVLEDYLRSYLKVLKYQPFRTTYIDGFAGSGTWQPRADDEEYTTASLTLFPELERDEPRKLLDGSARRALQLEEPFDEYVFIDQNPARCAVLHELKREFPHLAPRIRIYQADANEKIKLLCAEPWRLRRAVLFLDPYGMQVEWSTLEAVAATRAIDLWLLFPLGTGVVRLLKRSGDIPHQWRKRLNLLLGTEEWYEEFYQVERRPSLFGTDEEHVVRAGVDVIGQYFVRRLQSIFAGVAARPGILRNSKNNPLYLLCFAVANERGRRPALGIAEHLLRGMEQL